MAVKTAVTNRSYMIILGLHSQVNLEKLYDFYHLYSTLSLRENDVMLPDLLTFRKRDPR